MPYEQFTLDLDKQDENRIRSHQHTNEIFRCYSTELGSQDTRNSYPKSCRSGTEIAINCQAGEGGLEMSNTASSTSRQSPDSVCEEIRENPPGALTIPRSQSEPQCLLESEVKSKSSRSFRCEHCSKTFTRLYNLKSHLVTHERTMPYSCNICNRAFARKSDAKRHTRTHSGEKNWVCGGCQTPFARRDMLSSHHKSQKGQACLQREQSRWAQRDSMEKSQSPKVLSISSLLS